MSSKCRVDNPDPGSDIHCCCDLRYGHGGVHECETCEAAWFDVDYLKKEEEW